MQNAFNLSVVPNPSLATAWRLQDAKAQFSALVGKVILGLPQHVTRSGKRAVVVISEQDFEALQRNVTAGAAASLDFIDHLLAIPKADIDELEAEERLDMQPREVKFL